MVATLIAEDEFPITWNDCLDYLSEDGREYFWQNYGVQRMGQAWMNALTFDRTNDYFKLNGTFYDPFYRNGRGDVIRALMFLLEN